MYRTTANRLRRIAVVSALTVSASGGVLAGTLAVVNTGGSNAVNATATSNLASNSVKSAHATTTKSIPVAASQLVSTVAVTSPSGTVSRTTGN